MSWPQYDRGDLAAISFGGVGGAGLRWLVNRPPTPTDGGWFAYEPNTTATLAREFDLPVGTLGVNLLGCLLLGALTMLLARQLPLSRRLLVGAATGFCGSLTTFSTFAVEIAERLRGFPVGPRRSATYPVDYEVAFGAALSYLLLSLAGGALAFWLGRMTVARMGRPPRAATIGEVGDGP